MNKDKSVLFVAANPIGKDDTRFDLEYDRIHQELDFRLKSNEFRLRSPILTVNMHKQQRE